MLFKFCGFKGLCFCATNNFSTKSKLHVHFVQSSEADYAFPITVSKPETKAVLIRRQ